MFAHDNTWTQNSEISLFHENLRILEIAFVAFIRSDHGILFALRSATPRLGMGQPSHHAGRGEHCLDRAHE